MNFLCGFYFIVIVCIIQKNILISGPALGLNLHLLSPLLVEALASVEIDPEVKLKLFTSLSSVLLNRDENLELASEYYLQSFLNVILQGMRISTQ